ncbi:MAG: HAMP domain-containing histidine kinase [Candidatus Magnetominusculus sp. LBB02]|nr:HAMP domain-containing histidine kinase [Candidatus Magnetominusculus sp. LBB02]
MPDATDKLVLLGQMAAANTHEVLNLLNSVPIRIEADLKKCEQTAAALGKIEGILSGLRADIGDVLNPAHETKLTLIGSIADVLSKDQKDRTEDLSFVHKQIQRVIKIIDSLRSMSKTKRSFENIDIKRLIAEIIDDSAGSIARHKVQVVLDCPDGLYMKADLMELYSIFFNLIKNSCEAFHNITRDEGNTAAITVTKAEDGLIEIRFKDNGVGIAKERWESIFEFGFTDKGAAGTGVGLALVRTLVRQYGGDCTVIASTPEIGTEFRLTLHPEPENKG